MNTISLTAGHYAKVRGSDKLFHESSSYIVSSNAAKDDLLTSDFLQGKLGKLNMCLFKPLEGSGVTSTGKRLSVVVKAKKGKKHDYPWPDNIDPNLKSGHLRYLSPFKPLEEKPKPVTLAFEKPLVDLEQKIVEIRRMADETGLDFSTQIHTLELKYQQALKDLYTHLSPIQRLNIARHPNRPTVLDHIMNITEKWVELHGDRAGYDDPAIVTGIGTISGRSYVFIGHQKGRNTKENIARNFAMPTPHGYRKALRIMKYADHHGFPIVTLIDTPGAYADLKSEELGQGEAIAHNLREMFGLKVPVITVVTGEGGSGGALAIGCCNKMFMLENAAFYVASPEACAAILWKSAQASPLAAEKLRITAQEHYRLKIADGIIPEPLGGAHADPMWSSQQIKVAISEAMEELGKMSKEELIQHRMLKFRHIGGFQEGIPIEPKRKRKMKPAETTTSTSDIESEIEGLKKMILDAKPQGEPPKLEKIKHDVDIEMTKAFISMGLQAELESIKMELTKSSNMTLDLKHRADKLAREFKLKLSKPGEYMKLKEQLAKLEAVNGLIELKQEGERIVSEINTKVPAKLKEKMKILRVAHERVLRGEEVDKEELAEFAGEARRELEEVLRGLNLEMVETTSDEDVEQTVSNEVDEQIKAEIERTVDAAGIKGKIEELKAQVMGGSLSFEKAEKLKEEIKQKIVAAMDGESLREKVLGSGNGRA